MTIRTCPRGHLTTFRSCPACRDTSAKLRRDKRILLAENRELKRQVKNLTQAIAAGRAA